MMFGRLGGRFLLREGFVGWVCFERCFGLRFVKVILGLCFYFFY